VANDYRDPDDPIGTSAELRRLHEPEDEPLETDETAVEESEESDEDEPPEESDQRESE
jgi:hypothetical protein